MLHGQPLPHLWCTLKPPCYIYHDKCLLFIAEFHILRDSLGEHCVILHIQSLDMNHGCLQFIGIRDGDGVLLFKLTKRYDIGQTLCLTLGSETPREFPLIGLLLLVGTIHTTVAVRFQLTRDHVNVDNDAYVDVVMEGGACV